MNGLVVAPQQPDLGDRAQRGHAVLVHLRRATEDVLGDDLEHPPGTGELGLHLGVRRHGPDRSGRSSWTTDISDCYYPRYADERHRRVGGPLLHRARHAARRTRRCRPPGWPSSTTCRRPTWPRRSRRLTAAGITESRPGPAGRLPPGPAARRGHAARGGAGRRRRRHRLPVPRDPPARPGRHRRARAPTAAPAASPGPCGGPRTRGGPSWPPPSIGDLITELHRDRPAAAAAPRRRVDPAGRDHEEEPTMKIFLAGGTGVVGTRAAARAGGGRPRRHRRRPHRREGRPRPVAGRRAGDRSTCSTPARCAARGRRPRGRGQPGHEHPAAHQGGAGLGVGDQRAAAPRGVEPPRRRRARTPGRRGTSRSRSRSPTSTTATEWIDEDHPVDQVGPFTRRPRRRGRRGSLRRARRGRAWCCGSRQFYAPDSTPHAGLQRHRPPAGQPVPRARRRATRRFIHAEDAGSAVVAALRAPSGTYNVADDEPVTRAEAGRDRGRGARRRSRPTPCPKVVQAATPGLGQAASCDRCASRTAASRTPPAGEPAHPSIRGSWPA